jgi:hypothetical protein
MRGIIAVSGPSHAGVLYTMDCCDMAAQVLGQMKMCRQLLS